MRGARFSICTRRSRAESDVPEPIEYARSLRPVTTHQHSRAIRDEWSQRVRDESMFSARTTRKAYVDSLKKRLMEVATRTQTPQQTEDTLKRALADLGYTPSAGFPGNTTVPAAVPGSITDLSSSRRIQLIIDTNVKRARSMGQMASGEDPAVVAMTPAWRLTRMGARKKPRGDWRARWDAAGASVGWNGASRRQMVALKSSPIWKALGDGAGGFEDCLGSPYPPFAFGSGLAWEGVDAPEWSRICRAEGMDDGMAEIRRRAAVSERASAGPMSAKEKDAARAALARLRARREEREREGTAYTTTTPVPPPPYIHERPVPSTVSAARTVFGRSLDRIEAVRERTARIYLHAAERMERMATERLAGLAPTKSQSAQMEIIKENADLARRIEGECARFKDAVSRYDRMLTRAFESGASVSYGKSALYAAAAKRAAERAEALGYKMRESEERAAKAFKRLVPDAAGRWRRGDEA